jgi:hypothetical protein
LWEQTLPAIAVTLMVLAFVFTAALVAVPLIIIASMIFFARDLVRRKAPPTRVVALPPMPDQVKPLSQR